MGITDSYEQIFNTAQLLPTWLDEMQKKADKAAQNVEIIKWCAIGVAGVALILLLAKLGTIIERLRVCAKVGSLKPLFQLSEVKMTNVAQIITPGSGEKGKNVLLNEQQLLSVLNSPRVNGENVPTDGSRKIITFEKGFAYVLDNVELIQIGLGKCAAKSASSK